MSFLDFWHKLVFHPKAFFKEDFDGRSSPFLFITIAIYGFSSAIDRIDTQFTKYDLKGNYEQLSTINNWPTYLTMILIFGAVSGVLFYLLGGWFYNLRIKWSKGTPDREKARFLYLYPEFVPSFILVVTTFINSIGNPVPYVTSDELKPSELIALILLLITTYYSIYISYIGVTTVTDVNTTRAKLWFLILPLIVYTLALGAIFSLIITYF